MSTSPLLNLPLEIKDKIFTEVITPHFRFYNIWNHPAASRQAYHWVPKNVLLAMNSTLHRDFWFTMNHTTSLNLYIGDRNPAYILDAEEEGLVVATERRQALVKNLTRAHRINLLMRRVDDIGINGLQQLVEMLTLIQGLAGWQSKAITIEFGRRLGPLSKSAKPDAKLVSGAVVTFLAGCARGKIVPQVPNPGKAAMHWKDVLAVYQARFIPENEVMR